MSRIKVTKDITDAVLKQLKSLALAKVFVGIPSGENTRSDSASSYNGKKMEYRKPLGNAAIAYIQEKGSPAQGIPPTPFLVPGVRAAQDQLAKVLADGAANALSLDGANVDQTLNRCGLLAVSSVKSIIVNQVGFKKLKFKTIEARYRLGFKGVKRLIRTGQLLNSVTYVIKADE